MSWKDNIDNIKFKIKTGDGKEFFPLWKGANKSTEFNYSKFDFINVAGSEIDRRKPQSSSYTLNFIFQGENYITDSETFENSANDNRLWTVTHPIYGVLTGQPISVKRNDDNLNLTRFSVSFWESINTDYPDSDVSIQDNVFDKTERVRATSINSFSAKIKPVASDITVTKDSFNVSTSKLIPDDDSSVEYKSKVNKAIKSIDSLISDSETAANDMQDALNFATTFDDTILNKINNYRSAYFNLKETVGSVYEKTFFESQGSDLMANIALTSVLPIDGKNDYLTRSNVETISSLINETYLDYLTTLDNNQVSIYDVENTYNPDVNIQTELYELIVDTTQNLFALAFEARQERTIELEKDSNLILLTHRFLGLDANDENIETFRDINNIRLNEVFNLKKGRLITYYI